jgi:cytochrome c553
MDNGDRIGWSNPWVRWSIVWLCVLTIGAFLIGFVLLPSVHRDYTAGGIWLAICRAAGLPADWAPPPRREPEKAATSVVLLAAMSAPGSSDAIGRGATLALQQCSMCHGAQGMSEANAPNLAGQYPEVVIKQLQDYKRGDRSGSFMQQISRNLSDRDIDEIAAYYYSLPKARTAPARYDEASAPALVRVGDPLRNIAPCIGCHGGTDHKLGAPWLEGMPKEYLVVQLRDFQLGARRNDSHAQMRNMTRAMTAAEIEQVAEFYARRPKEGDGK